MPGKFYEETAIWTKYKEIFCLVYSFAESKHEFFWLSVMSQLLLNFYQLAGPLDFRIHQAESQNLIQHCNFTEKETKILRSRQIVAELRTPVSYLLESTLSIRPHGLTYKNSGASITPYSNLFGFWIHIIWRASLGSKGYCSMWIYFILEFSITRDLFENLSVFIQFLSSDNKFKYRGRPTFYKKIGEKNLTHPIPFLHICF